MRMSITCCFNRRCRTWAVFMLVWGWRLSSVASTVASTEPRMANLRAVFVTTFGDIEMGFYPEVDFSRMLRNLLARASAEAQGVICSPQV
jgi:hypothetical protein